MSKELKKRIAVAFEGEMRGGKLQCLLADVLAEVAKGECFVKVTYLRGESLAHSDYPEPSPCGSCIVCVSREVVKG